MCLKLLKKMVRDWYANVPVGVLAIDRNVTDRIKRIEEIISKIEQNQSNNEWNKALAPLSFQGS